MQIVRSQRYVFTGCGTHLGGTTFGSQGWENLVEIELGIDVGLHGRFNAQVTSPSGHGIQDHGTARSTPYRPQHACVPVPVPPLSLVFQAVTPKKKQRAVGNFYSSFSETTKSHLLNILSLRLLVNS
jgi:hypothetical protein